MITLARVRRLSILFAAGLSAIAATPTPTPSPKPILTGGFGKTPAPPTSARRQVEKKQIRITNESLVTESDRGRVSTSEVRPPATATPPTAEARVTPVGAEPTPLAGEAGEEYWRGEARRLRERVATIKGEIERLDAEAKRLELDFYAWDDGAYRDRVIKPAWDKAREELATARKELPVAEKELAELPDRARRAGAFPSWIRE